ncbi:hypothetical protein [Kocuria palustris]|uniref:hypothetical protein n=1 Tax=Kocuria palustris TaxID=71999 RepID=UPI0011A9784E|nr:hypothetical protein [Kocuria palustris]
MYAWIFRHLPGPFAVRVLLLVVLIAAAILALMQWVFPWIQQEFSPLQGEITVDTPPAAQQ